jgi:hypothetical protein
MGIYTNGTVFGITMYNFADGDDLSNTLFEEKYEEIMSHEQMREAYLYYTTLSEINKNGILFKIYTECTSTHDIVDKQFMMWYPISLNEFLKKINI